MRRTERCCRLNREMPSQGRKAFYRRFTLALLGLTWLGTVVPLAAENGRFDLLGPPIDIHVTRGAQSLPIASVPNLLPGDRLLVHADLPSTQSVHLLLVVAFLRGSTNPPPDGWFTRIETWNRHVRDEGITVTVPNEAQQALIFIAPETGGDFSTLKSAVRGRPGIFVRASQDLNEASFEQSRIERYAQALQHAPTNSPEELLDHSRKLAATLNLKPNDDCFKRPPDTQLACLRQSGMQLLLDDGHGQNLAQMLSSGPSSDLIGAVAGTPVATQGGAASYSAYVGTVLDVVRLLTGLHTAKFQYIPAIAFPDADALNLRLNTAPSFHDPKSVIVIALPAIQEAVPPPLQLQDAHHVSCLLQPRMVLPLNGAPLVFATGFAHDLSLHLDMPGPDGRTELPLIPSAYDGGLIVSTEPARKPLAASAPPVRDAKSIAPGTEAVPAETVMKPAPLVTVASTGPVEITGKVHGFWGFDPFDGPALPLQRIPGKGWVAATHSEMFVGRVNTLLLRSDGTACTREVELDSQAAAKKLEWKLDDSQGPGEIAVKLPLEKNVSGGLTLAVYQFGSAAPQKVPFTAYSDETRVQEFRMHAGDSYATLAGSGLINVKSVDLNGIIYQPFPEGAQEDKSLRLSPAMAGDPDKDTSKKTGNLVYKAGDHASATVTLQDGRTLPVSFTVDASRPAFTLLSQSVQPAAHAGLLLTLGDKADLPLSAKLTLALRSDSPVKFPRTQKVEIATTDGTLDTKLSLADRTLVLQDSRTALAFVTPATVFGPSAFGPIQMRLVAEDGNASDWQPLGTLVRTPTLTAMTCASGPRAAGSGPAHPYLSGSRLVLTSMAAKGTQQQPESAKRPELPCQLTGTDLFLIDSVSGSGDFENAVMVPAGYAEGALAVPRPADGKTIFLKLRDDVEHIAQVTLEVRSSKSSAP